MVHPECRAPGMTKKGKKDFKRPKRNSNSFILAQVKKKAKRPTWTKGFEKRLGFKIWLGKSEQRTFRQCDRGDNFIRQCDFCVFRQCDSYGPDNIFRRYDSKPPPPPPPVSLPPTQPTPEGASCLEGGREESEGQFTANSSFDVTFFARATVHTHYLHRSDQRRAKMSTHLPQIHLWVHSLQLQKDLWRHVLSQLSLLLVVN